MNILITSAGRRVSLIEYFRKELHDLFGLESKVLTTDLKPSLSPACRKSDEALAIGRFTDHDYIDSLLEICGEHQIKLIVPTIDTELDLLANNYEVFLSAGVEVVISSPDFVQLCSSKYTTNQFFLERGMEIARSIDRKNPTFPLFIKPVNGSSGKDLYYIRDASFISEYLKDERFIWMQYIDPADHQEYTIDLYYDREGILKCVVPRIRLRVRAGETSKGLTERNDVVINTVKDSLNFISGARGCITLQLFRNYDHNTLIGIEINPRFGGGFPLSYLAGANFPRWILKEYLLDGEIPYYDDWEDKLLMLRYDQEMIVHDFQYQQ